MPLNEERIKQLLEGHLENQLTDAEQNEFFKAIRTDEVLFRQVAESLSSHFTGKDFSLDLENREAILSAIFAPGRTVSLAIQNSKNVPSVTKSEFATNTPDKNIAPFRIIGSKWTRWAAAIVLTIGIGSTLYYTIRKPVQVSPELGHKKIIDIAPGGNKAILTLSNGSKIILDSARNGILAHQAGSNIIKTDSGQLTYNTNGESSIKVLYNTLNTPRGGQFQLKLPDGTKVWLNAASSITYPTAFIGKERIVTVSGEAYFEVVHNTAKPFKVKVNGVEIQDIGTHFNINAYGDENDIKTTLLEGSVKISTAKESKIMMPGQQALSTLNGVGIEITKDVNLEKIMAWRNGELALSHGSVRQLMQDISRWYDVDIEYQYNAPEGKYFGYVDRNVPLSSLLNVLKAYGIETKLEGKKIIVK